MLYIDRFNIHFVKKKYPQKSWNGADEPTINIFNEIDNR